MFLLLLFIVGAAGNKFGEDTRLPFIHFIIQPFIGTKFDTWKGKSLRRAYAKVKIYTTNDGQIASETQSGRER